MINSFSINQSFKFTDSMIYNVVYFKYNITPTTLDLQTEDGFNIQDENGNDIQIG